MATNSRRGGKMLQLVNYRLKVTVNDGRYLIGQMLAYDKHMNLVLADCDEFRLIRKKPKGHKPTDLDEGPQEVKRSLGLVILRGETVVSISVEGGPPVPKEDAASLVPGVGKGAPAGRGMGLMSARPLFYLLGESQKAHSLHSGTRRSAAVCATWLGSSWFRGTPWFRTSPWIRAATWFPSMMGRPSPPPTWMRLDGRAIVFSTKTPPRPWL